MTSSAVKTLTLTAPTTYVGTLPKSLENSAASALEFQPGKPYGIQGRPGVQEELIVYLPDAFMSANREGAAFNIAIDMQPEDTVEFRTTASKLNKQGALKLKPMNAETTQVLSGRDDYNNPFSTLLVSGNPILTGKAF